MRPIHPQEHQMILSLPDDHPRKVKYIQQLEGIKTPQQIQAEIVAQIQANLDAFARTRGYDNIMSACTYKDSTVPQFAAEAARCIELRDQTWATCYNILAQVQAGSRTMPTLEEVLAEVPALTWE